jgi:hypothetical protein
MKLENDIASTVYRALNKFSTELEPAGPWRWNCALLNGARLPIAASLQDGFLHLACHAGPASAGVQAIESALLANSSLAGGVKLAIDASTNALRLRTDIVVADEEQLLHRLHWALDGFHDGHSFLKSPASFNPAAVLPPSVPSACLADLLSELSWPFTERGPNEYSVELDADSASSASIRTNSSGVVLSIELLRANAIPADSRRAIALFLLTAGSGIRMVRAQAAEADAAWSCGFQVALPHSPSTEEIGHALAALSIAHRTCVRETNVLLDDAAARCYLAARHTSTTNDYQSEHEEN